jgi:hypothetical protein
MGSSPERTVEGSPSLSLLRDPGFAYIGSAPALRSWSGGASRHAPDGAAVVLAVGPGYRLLTGDELGGLLKP